MPKLGMIHSNGMFLALFDDQLVIGTDDGEKMVQLGSHFIAELEMLDALRDLAQEGTANGLSGHEHCHEVEQYISIETEDAGENYTLKIVELPAFCHQPDEKSLEFPGSFLNDLITACEKILSTWKAAPDRDPGKEWVIGGELPDSLVNFAITQDYLRLSYEAGPGNWISLEARLDDNKFWSRVFADCDWLFTKGPAGDSFLSVVSAQGITYKLELDDDGTEKLLYLISEDANGAIPLHKSDIIEIKGIMGVVSPNDYLSLEEEDYKELCEGGFDTIDEEEGEE